MVVEPGSRLDEGASAELDCDATARHVMGPWRERLHEIISEMTVELARAYRMPITTEACPDCGAGGHDADAAFCKFCGSGLQTR